MIHHQLSWGSILFFYKEMDNKFQGSNAGSFSKSNHSYFATTEQHIFWMKIQIKDLAIEIS